MKKNPTVGALGLLTIASHWSAIGLPSSSGARLPAGTMQTPVAKTGDTEFFKAISSGQWRGDPERCWRLPLKGRLRKTRMEWPFCLRFIWFTLLCEWGLWAIERVIRIFMGRRACGNDEKIRSLISESLVLLNAFAPDGFSALHLASFFGRSSSQEILIAARASHQRVFTK